MVAIWQCYGHPPPPSPYLSKSFFCHVKQLIPIWFSDPFSSEICIHMKGKRRERRDIVYKENNTKERNKEKWECGASGCCCSADVQLFISQEVSSLILHVFWEDFLYQNSHGWQCSKPMGLSLTRLIPKILYFLITISVHFRLTNTHNSSTHNVAPLSHTPWRSHPEITHHWAWNNTRATPIPWKHSCWSAVHLQYKKSHWPQCYSSTAKASMWRMAGCQLHWYLLIAKWAPSLSLSWQLTNKLSS